MSNSVIDAAPSAGAEDGGRVPRLGGRRPAGRLAGWLLAAATVATSTVSRWSWSTAARLIVVVVAATLALVPDQAGPHRLGVVVLAVSLLAAAARNLSRGALRCAVALVAAGAVVALASIGDRAAHGPPGPAARDQAAAALDQIADEATSLRQELPCDHDPDRPRPPDDRLCAALDDLGDRAGDAADAGDVDAVAGLSSALGGLREDVAVRLLPSATERPARVELAQARRAAGPTGAAPADGAVADADAGDGRDLRALVADGGATVLADVLDPVLDDDTTPRPGLPGWIALLVLACLGYRYLETVNNRRYAAPIVVDDVVTPTGGHDRTAGEVTTAIRNRIAERDVREPPLVPGTESTSAPMPDLVAALDTRPSRRRGWLPAAGARLTGLLAPPPGITVEPAYSCTTWPPADPGADGNGRRPDLGDGGSDPGGEGDGATTGGDGAAISHVVTVRLVTTRGRRALRARSFVRPTVAGAAQAAADFVVCESITASRLTPSWARWHSDDGTALAPYRAVLTDTGRTGPRLALRHQIELLEAARAASPGTGLVLVELGHRYDLDERPLDALRAHLTTRVLHPRFTQARYRTALSLAMLAAPGRLAEHWLDPERAADRRQIAELLVDGGLIARAGRSRWWRNAAPRCPADATELVAWLAQPEPSPAVQRDILKVFLLLARAELATLERRLGVPGLLAGAARQSERHVWLRLLADPDRRRAARHGCRSGRWIAELRLALLPAEPGTRRARQLQRKVDALAQRDLTGATTLYNAACFTSVLADRSPLKSTERAELEQRAVHYLGRAVRSGRGPMPSSGWLTTDPDLVALQAVPAFNDLVRRLATDEDRRAEAADLTPV